MHTIFDEIQKSRSCCCSIQRIIFILFFSHFVWNPLLYLFSRGKCHRPFLNLSPSIVIMDVYFCFRLKSIWEWIFLRGNILYLFENCIRFLFLETLRMRMRFVILCQTFICYCLNIWFFFSVHQKFTCVNNWRMDFLFFYFSFSIDSLIAWAHK